MQHLFRDRGRLQRNKGRSTYSVSGLSFSNGRAARFSVGTPGTPDDRVISPTFSVYSTGYYRPDSNLGDADPVSSNENSARSELYRENARSRSFVRPHSVALDATDVRVSISNSFVLESDEVVASSSRASLGDAVSQVCNNPPRTVELGKDSRHRRNISLPFSRENSVNFERVVAQVVPSPSSPASPPQYENAIMMKPIPSTGAGNQQLVQPKNRPSEVKLKRNSRYETRGTREHLFNSPVSMEECSPLDRLGSETSVRNSTAAACSLAENILPTNLPPGNPKPTEFKHKLEQNLHDPQPSYNQQHPLQQHEKYYQQEQYNSTSMSNCPLKTLPKVSSSIYVESDDSDSECLHSSQPETASRQNVPFGNECLSRDPRGLRYAERVSIAQFDGTGIQTSSAPIHSSPLPPHLREGSIPSTAVCTTAATLASSGGRTGAEGGHQETPV
ncbi:hypothetical protein ElyMa_003903800 [Elysia marginata]|uniref:Uncharacterized protein n=1 Tax=Elysia marginata TaxID=1093978 RepID=A0AAV4FNP7_9GAST|nr:hypothetical protein ElyMa_003903800 [Elysia marginata]